MVAGVGHPPDQTGALGSVDQLHDRVVPEQQVVGHLSDGRLAVVASHCEEQLVLGRGQICGPGLTLTPALEPAQAVAKLEQSSVVGVGQLHNRIVSRYDFRVNVSRSYKRLLAMTGLAAVVGLLAGLAAWVLIHLIGLITNLALFGRWGWELPSFTELDPGPELVVIAVLGAAVVVVFAKWSPIIRGHGIPEAMDAILNNQSRIAPRTAVAKPASAAVAIGTGGPFGAEGPIIVTGGAIGSLLGQVIHVSPNERKILLASGAAAGMAATFGTPLAAVVLAIELLLFEFSARAFIPLVVASSVAGGVHALLFGSGPLFTVPPHDFSGLGQLPVFAVVGLICGVLATVIAKGLFAFEAGYERLPIKDTWHPIIGAVAFASVGLLVPRSLGVGYDVIDDALAGGLAVGTLATLAGAKLLVWWIALASGTSGGTLAPILIISSTSGALMGEVASELFPGLGISPGTIALVAMAATFGAATRAPFAAIVFLFELTRDYEAILPLMGATVLADLVARGLLSDSLMTEKLGRRGVRVPSVFTADVLRTTSVRDVMTREVETLSADCTVGEAVDHFGEGGHSAYPLVDGDGVVVGILTRSDLLEKKLSDDAHVEEVATRDIVSVGPDDQVVDALERILEEGIEHLPVIDQGHMVGICTRTDVLAARRQQLEHERPQKGWLARLPRRMPRRATGEATPEDPVSTAGTEHPAPPSP